MLLAFLYLINRYFRDILNMLLMKAGKNIRVSAWKPVGFLLLLLCLLASYRFVSSPAATMGCVVALTEDGQEVMSAGGSSIAEDTDHTQHFLAKYRHAHRKRGISRNNYLKRVLHPVEGYVHAAPAFVSVVFSGYRWLYVRPSYYNHLFRYALF